MKAKMAMGLNAKQVMDGLIYKCAVMATNAANEESVELPMN